MENDFTKNWMLIPSKEVVKIDEMVLCESVNNDVNAGIFKAENARRRSLGD